MNNVNSWGDFTEVAKRVAAQEGFPIAVLLGQAALETGRNVGSAPGNNFFGIKGAGTAGSQNLKTWEDYGSGPVTINDNFAAYANPEDSIRAYINLIKQNYPRALLTDDPVQMIREIKAGGYATDPNYVEKVISTPEFREYAYQRPSPTPTKANQPQEKPTNLLDSMFNYFKPGQAMASSYDPTNPSSLMNYSENPYAQQNKPLVYNVKPGDTLWGIAEQYMGGGQNWKQLGYSGSPYNLQVGTKLNVPQIYNNNATGTYTPSSSGGGGGGGGGGVPAGSSQNYTPATPTKANVFSSGISGYVAPSSQKQNVLSSQPRVTNTSQPPRLAPKLDFRPSFTSGGSAQLR